jgi:hypothetical protein
MIVLWHYPRHHSMPGSNSQFCVLLYKLRSLPPFSFLPVVTALTIVEFIVVIPGLFGLRSELLK